MQDSIAKIASKFSAVTLMMIVLVLVTNTDAMARPHFKMKTKQIEAATNIKLKVAETTKVWMNVYNSEGRYVAELMNERRVKKGKSQNIEVNTSGWKTGIYKVEIRTSSGKVWTESLVISR